MITKVKMNTSNSKPKKMDVDVDLHIRINLLQSKLFEKFRVKVKIQDITNEAINKGLQLAEKSISEQLTKELIISPVE